MKPRFINCVAEISADDWNGLTGAQTAFTCYEFLHALESSGSVSPATGWHPSHLIWEAQGKVAGALPLYRKYHSYGEYVFDWSWADAFQQTGQNYYPKLLCAIPFTPVPGPRILTRGGVDSADLWCRSLDYLKDFLDLENMSSLHLLFSDSDLQKVHPKAQLLKRQDVQFVWHNNDYCQFADFLATLKSSKRKQIRRERKRIRDQSIEVSRLWGNSIDVDSLESFYQCYQETYLKRSGHRGYLNRDFFFQLLKLMPEKLMLVIARLNETPIASALFFVDNHQLCGRYWGCLEERDCLHFEVCYYQGIEFCIEQNLARFNPGTQGEHKLVRGFEPMRTQSFHLIAHPQFRQAVQHSLVRENTYIDAYEESAKSHLPFREV